MEKVIITNNIINESITIGSQKPYILKKIEGTGGLAANNHLIKTPYQDGKSYRGTDTDVRLISLYLAILSDTEKESNELKQRISRVLNPKAGLCTLKYVYDGGEKEIDILIETAPKFSPNESTVNVLNTSVHFVAPQPFWKSVYTESEVITTWSGGMTFPLKFPNSFSTKGSPELKIINGGDVETPVKIEFTGPATNPVITNTGTGEFVKVKQTLAANEILHVSTEFENKYVEIENTDTGVKTNAFNWITLDSTFFKLGIGNNTIKGDSDDASSEAAIVVKWKNRYIGI